MKRKRQRPGRTRQLLLSLLLCAAALGAGAPAAGVPPAQAPPVAVPPPANGNAAYLKAQADVAKKALRSRDYDTAEAAWVAVLEFDPVNLAALQGLVEVAEKRGEPDAEALHRRELNTVYTARVLAGESKLQRTLDKSLERQAELDPFSGEAEQLVADHSAAMAELGGAYLEGGFYANALFCWTERLMTVHPKSEEATAAREAITRCLEEGPDYVAFLNIAPDVSDGGKDAEWIADFDKKTATFRRAGEWTTPHYRIKVAGNWRLGEATAQVMEQVSDFYREIWGIQPDPKPKKPDPTLRDVNITPIALNIYENHTVYVKKTGSPDWSGGVFMGSEVATYDHGSRGGSWRDTLSTLFHEASHQFMREAVGGVPSFVNEGIACQFESIEILPNGTIRRDAPNKRYLQAVVDLINNDPSFGLSFVMDPKNGNEPKFYAPRWGLFHFLRMYVDEQGGYVFRAQLENYLYEFKKGTPGNAVEHFEEHMLLPVQVEGMETFAEFEAVWRQWLLDLQASLKGRDKRLDEYRGKARMASLRKEHERALAFWERCFDLEPDDLEILAGLAAAAEKAGQDDRAVFLLRRWLAGADTEDRDRPKHEATVARLDRHAKDYADARRDLVGGMAGLAQRYDREELPLLAMAVAQDVLAIDPWDAAARALVSRLERETGQSVVRWQRLFNGNDLEGWFAGGSEGAFLVRDGVLTADYSRVTGGSGAAEAGVALYQTLFVDRSFAGDWSMEARIRTSQDWDIAGLCFGARDADNFEGIVLRRGNDGMNRVDFGSFDGVWSYRGDGAYKASYDPSAGEGTLLRVDVSNREVSVTIDGKPLMVVVDGKERRSIKYPMLALKGDAGLLASKGITRYTDLKLLAGRSR
jgi:tetratricopeptide (TPR) repeat protein